MDLRQQRWDVREKRELFRLQIMCGRAALNDSRSVGRSVKVHNLKVNKNAQVTKKIIKKEQKITLHEKDGNSDIPR